MKKYCDPFEEENIDKFGEMFDRVEHKLCSNLKNSNAYHELIHSCNTIKEQFPHLLSLIESFEVSYDVYSIDEVKALAKYIENMHMITNYEKFEMYKVGFHECIELFQFLNIL